MLCALIMAGGKGTRFWPLSTEEKPKQFLNLIGDETMIQMTVNRIKLIVPIERIFICTGNLYVDLVREQLPDLPNRNIIIEPEGRNTTPGIALSAHLINRYYKDSTMVVLPSDHLINDEEEFRRIILVANKFIENNNNAIITLGMEPTRAETGYGYIKCSKSRTKLIKNEVIKVEKFVEKPNKELAKKYVSSGNYLWNGGMFIWTVKNILREIRKYSPKTFDALRDIEGIEEEKLQDLINRKYRNTEAISIDYSVLEKSKEVYVIPSDFGWDDIGSWEAIERYKEKDDFGNIVIGQAKSLKGSNNLLVSSNHKVIVEGLSEIYAIENDGKIMIGEKSNVVNVKELKNVVYWFKKMEELLMKKVALITGITGQDGSYLTELLLEKGYEVHGIIRRHSSISTSRIDHLFENPKIGNKSLFLHYGDLTDSSNLNRLIEKIKPIEIYNLAAQSHVAVSFEVPEYTAEVTGVGTLRLLDAIRETGVKCKFYQASTSELFGGLPETAPQSEKTPFYPKSPYGAAKLYSYWITVNYRESYDLFACNGILFNHESPRRGETFVTRKITRAVASIMAGKQEKLSLGNLDAKRDWGFAGDYVYGMWLMLQQDKPDDYVLATNETHTVREFVNLAFKEVGIEIEWKGTGVDEKGYDKSTGRLLVDVNPRYFRPTEVDLLWGNSSKAERELGWKRKVSFQDLVSMMVDADMKEIAGKEVDATKQ